MSILYIVAAIVVSVIYSVVATFVFINMMIESSTARAFGWPGPKLLECFFVAVFWPIVLIIGFLISLYEWIANRNENTD